MIKAVYDKVGRKPRVEQITTDFLVVGGGISGVCAAVTAARAGVKVVLMQDRPVLGGNGSSEVRLWVLGATSHMGNNNRWAREGGVIDEILVENTYRNPEGNPVLFDMVLLDIVKREPNISLLLNTAAFSIEKSAENRIEKVIGLCPQNETIYEVKAKFFCDASGDGIISYQAGCSYRVGGEARDEFGEKFAPENGSNETLGHTIFFYTKDAGKPVRFVAPEIALKDVEKEVPRYREIDSKVHGCKYWWLEYGGLQDTVLNTEEIKYELWRVVYGVWDYIKNSGKFKDVENQTLEWVGLIPGKRESRRFEGLYMIKQQDVVEQAHFDDAVAFGGWAIDMHPADGVYSTKPGCTQYHSKGVYEIPYRCFIGDKIDNLFFAGRIISATQIAYGTTRVMCTCGHGAQAVGMAAALCLQGGLKPVDLLSPDRMKVLQNELNRIGQSIPFVPISKEDNVAAQAEISASSSYEVFEIPANGPWISLEFSVAQLLPFNKGDVYRYAIMVNAKQDTALSVELRCSSKAQNHTPDILVEKVQIPVKKGEQKVDFSFSTSFPETQYAFICFIKNEDVSIKGSNHRITGIVSAHNKYNKAVATSATQTPPPNSGIEEFDFWCPQRRPDGHNVAMEISPSLKPFASQNAVDGYVRPYSATHAWVADPFDSNPMLNLTWNELKTINSITLHLDTDYDHPMESVQMGHAEAVMPFVLRNYKVLNDKDEVVGEVRNNHQTINKIVFKKPVVTKKLTIVCEHPNKNVPAAIFQIVVD